MVNQMIDKLRKDGGFSNCLAVCDVSASMFGVPMNAAITLSYMFSQMCEHPWGNLICTFSANPTFHVVNQNIPFAARMQE